MSKAKNPMRQTHLTNNQSNNRLHDSRSRDAHKEAFNQTEYNAIQLDSTNPILMSQTPHKKKISLKNYLKQST